jgi:hypothetical protein
MERAHEHKMKDKITLTLVRQGKSLENKNQNNYKKREVETHSYWSNIYINCLLMKKGLLLPKIVSKYIQKKVKDKFVEITKESARTEKSLDDLMHYYIRQTKKLRTKIVDRNRAMGIELENTEYFQAPARRQNFFLSITKKFKNAINNPNNNNNTGKQLNFLGVFNLDKSKPVNTRDSSEENLQRERVFQQEMEKVKKRIKEEKVKLENAKKVNKKYMHIKSRLLTEDKPGSPLPKKVKIFAFEEDDNIATKEKYKVAPHSTRLSKQIRFNEKATEGENLSLTKGSLSPKHKVKIPRVKFVETETLSISRGSPVIRIKSPITIQENMTLTKVPLSMNFKENSFTTSFLPLIKSKIPKNADSNFKNHFANADFYYN